MNDRDRAAIRHHYLNAETHKGVCWGPTPADYAAVDAESAEKFPKSTERSRP